MKRASTIFLQCVIVLIGSLTLFILIRFPLYEGRNANATFKEVYFHDPFLAYIYVAFIAVFVAYLQAFRLLAYIRNNAVFSPQGVNALRIIKVCALTFIAFLLGAEAIIIVTQYGKDDIAGGVMMGLFLIFITSVVAAAAGVFERMLQSALDFKSENDLTV
jgi:hypothetical protein